MPVSSRLVSMRFNQEKNPQVSYPHERNNVKQDVSVCPVATLDSLSAIKPLLYYLHPKKQNIKMN